MTVWAYVGCGGFVGHHIHLMKQAGRLRLSVYPMYHILHYSHTILTSWNTSTFKYGVKCNAWMRRFVSQAYPWVESLGGGALMYVVRMLTAAR